MEPRAQTNLKKIIPKDANLSVKPLELAVVSGSTIKFKNPLGNDITLNVAHIINSAQSIVSGASLEEPFRNSNKRMPHNLILQGLSILSELYKDKTMVGDVIKTLLEESRIRSQRQLDLLLYSFEMAVPQEHTLINVSTKINSGDNREKIEKYKREIVRIKTACSAYIHDHRYEGIYSLLKENHLLDQEQLQAKGTHSIIDRYITSGITSLYMAYHQNPIISETLKNQGMDFNELRLLFRNVSNNYINRKIKSGHYYQKKDMEKDLVIKLGKLFVDTYNNCNHKILTVEEMTRLFNGNSKNSVIDESKINFYLIGVLEFVRQDLHKEVMKILFGTNQK